MKKKNKILVIGAGSWGTSIANLLAKNSNQVFLFAKHKEIISEINNKKTNKKFLPEINLHKNLVAVDDFVNDVDLVFIVVPSKSNREVFFKISQTKFKKNCIFVICSKGIDGESLLLLSESFEEITKNKNFAVLSGPNFALEVAKEQPTITTIGCKSKKNADFIISAMNNKNFYAKYFKDPRTVEICGIMKNIIAIGCGMVDGLCLGNNAKAALVVKGIEEINNICKNMKIDSNISHAAGFGDIFLTCSSTKSRNNLFGFLIATTKKIDKNITYEGLSSLEKIIEIAKSRKIKLNFSNTINHIISSNLSKEIIKQEIIKMILSNE